MLDLIRENWFALISFIVAIIGGVPGILAVLNEWKARPKLAAYLHHLLLINTKDLSGVPLTGLMLHVAVGNKGKDPLVPLAFQLECKIDGKWMSFESSSIPEGFVISGLDWQYKYTNVSENDIQKRQSSITRESPVYGYLSFVSKEIDFEKLKKIYIQTPIKLKCVDLFGKIHEIIFNRDLKPTINRHLSLPPSRGVEATVSHEPPA